MSGRTDGSEPFARRRPWGTGSQSSFWRACWSQHRRGSPSPQSGQPSVTVLDSKEVQSIVGSEIRSAADEDMGRIVDVLVDGSKARCAPRSSTSAAFSASAAARSPSTGRRCISSPAANKRYRIVLELTKDQVKPAPEYKEGKPTIVLGAAGNLEPLP